MRIVGGGRIRSDSANPEFEGAALAAVGVVAAFVSAHLLEQAGATDELLVLLCWILPNALLVCVLLLNVLSSSGWRLAASLCCIGVCLNIVVVVANLGMPVLAGDPRAGSDITAGSWLHVPGTASRLPVLGDVIGIPLPGGKLGLASLGDVFLIIGVAWALAIAVVTYILSAKLGSDRPSGVAPPFGGRDVL